MNNINKDGRIMREVIYSSKTTDICQACKDGPISFVAHAIGEATIPSRPIVAGFVL